jgi:hypothetical protein
MILAVCRKWPRRRSSKRALLRVGRSSTTFSTSGAPSTHSKQKSQSRISKSLIARMFIAVSAGRGKWQPTIAYRQQGCAASSRRALLFLFSRSCFASLRGLQAGQDQRRRIYFLESLSPTQPAAIRTIEGFKKRLSEKTTENFEIFIDYLDLGRFPGQAHIDRSARFLAGKYAEAPPDVLIPLGRAAIPFMVKYRDVIAPQVPIIFVNVPAGEVTEANALANTVSVVTEYNFAKTLELARRLQPAARNLVVVAGASDYDRYWENDARRELEPYRDRYQTRYLLGLPYNEMLKEVSQMPRDTIVIMSFVFMDGTGLPRIPPNVAAKIADISAAPVYSPIPTFFGRGVIGGYMDSYESEGAVAADLALGILTGKAPATLNKETKSLHRYEVDARQLERWGLSSRNLPPDTLVSFRAPSLWDQYRWQILLVAGALLGQLLLIIGLLYQRRRRQQAEVEARQRVAELLRMNRRVVAGEMSATIAHEVNQPLTAILSNAETLHDLLGQKNLDLEKSREIVADIIEEDTQASEVIPPTNPVGDGWPTGPAPRERSYH